MSANRVIGVDLGGTKILAGLIDADGRVHETLERPTVTTSQAALLDELADLVRALPQDNVGAVGFGIPSRIDQRKGIALGAVNIPLRDTPFRAEMERRLDLPISMENDASSAAYAEFRAWRRSRHGQPRHAHARHGCRGRRRRGREALPRLDRARPHGDHRGRRAVPGRVLGPRASRGVLLGPLGRQARTQAARPARDGARPGGAAAPSASRRSAITWVSRSARS